MGLSLYIQILYRIGLESINRPVVEQKIPRLRVHQRNLLKAPSLFGAKRSYSGSSRLSRAVLRSGGDPPDNLNAKQFFEGNEPIISLWHNNRSQKTNPFEPISNPSTNGYSVISHAREVGHPVLHIHMNHLVSSRHSRNWILASARMTTERGYHPWDPMKTRKRTQIRYC